MEERERENGRTREQRKLSERVFGTLDSGRMKCIGFEVVAFAACYDMILCPMPLPLLRALDGMFML